VGRTASEEVVLYLVHRKCLASLLYGIEVCPLTKLTIVDFVVMRFLWNRSVRPIQWNCKQMSCVLAGI